MAEFFVTASLILETALHIGSGKGGDPTDAPVRRAGDGRLLIPATAVAGSLRATATRLAPRLGFKQCQALENALGKMPCGCVVCQLFGDINPIERPTPAPNDWVEATASRLWIEDAFANVTSATFIRDGVGIDRRMGHAAKNVKFDYEVVPAQTPFMVKMRLAYFKHDSKEDKERIEMVLAAVLAEWEAGRGQLGGNISRGLGRVRLENVTIAQPQLNTATALVNFLKATDRAAASQPIGNWLPKRVSEAREKLASTREGEGATAVATAFVTIQFKLRFTDFFLQHDPLVALIAGFDHAPLIEKLTDDGLGNPMLAGSSLRGVLRSHAGKIIRTLYTAYCLDEMDDSADAFKQNCPACNVLESSDTEAIASCNSRLERDEKPKHEEWLEKEFCLTCQLFGNQERGSRFWVQDAIWERDDIEWQAQDFLAIDRFTGGGLDGAKFDAAPLTQAVFETAVTLHNPSEWELGLLALLLRDLADERLTLGFGAAKGYGRVQATDFVWQVGYLHDEDLVVNGRSMFPQLEAEPSGLYQLATLRPKEWLPPEWQTHAESWVTQFNEAVTDFKRSEYVNKLKTDSFLGTDMEQLYGRSRVEMMKNE